MVFVEGAKKSFKDLKESFLASSDYATKTSGTSHSPEATPVALSHVRELDLQDIPGSTILALISSLRVGQLDSFSITQSAEDDADRILLQLLQWEGQNGPVLQQLLDVDHVLELEIHWTYRLTIDSLTNSTHGDGGG